LIVSAKVLAESTSAMRVTIYLAVALELSILVAAPMSEARYGLFILIAGQVATLVACLDAWFRRSDAVHSAAGI
jgi:hypothetical protein